MKLQLEAKESINLGLETVSSVKVPDTRLKNDSNARFTDLGGMGVEIVGKIRANIAGVTDGRQ